MSSPPESLLSRLEFHATESPNKTAVTFLQSDEKSASSLTYSELHSATNCLARWLLDYSRAGDRILLVYPPCSPHFLLSFLACLRAGIIAVPVYPPHPSRSESVAAFSAIAKGCDAKVALTNGEYMKLKRLDKLTSFRASKWPQVSWIVTDKDDVSKSSQELLLPSPPASSSVAFLQYTSGSTSDPKGVMITHLNLSHNLSIIVDELSASSSTVVVSWLPQYHDMGLIGSMLGTLYCGGSGYYLSPIAFLARPSRWLEAVSTYRATHLQAPNFAFGLTARKFSEDEYFFETEDENKRGRKHLDLSCVEHIINGAEPVTETSIEAFELTFRPFGLPKGVIHPTYGLAEHTVFVSSGGKGRLTVKRRELEEENRVVIIEDTIADHSDVATVRLLGCGFPSRQNVNICIVDPECRTSLEDDCVGEIWIDSPSKALGYFGNDDVTKSEFHAVMAGSDSSDLPSVDYLRSGDLGFLHKHELYVCGRLKDLIIVAGRNYYPQDLEALAESVSSGIRPGCSAAFSISPNSNNVYDGEIEDVVLTLELKDPPTKPMDLQSTCEAIASTVRAEINKEFSLSVSIIVLLKAKSVPKTTSGKISRSRTKKSFISGTLDELYRANFKGDNRNIVPSTLAEPTDINVGSHSVSDGIQSAPLNALSTEDIKTLDRREIRVIMLNAISQISNIDKSLISDTSPLNTFMDSVSIAQLKGMLEGQYNVKALTDEYLFRDSTTLNRLVEVVKMGESLDESSSASVGIVAAESRGGISGALGCPPGVVCCTIM